MKKIQDILDDLIITGQCNGNLPYSEDLLEPYISAKTLSYHQGKHLAAYLANTAKLKAGTPLENATLGQIVLQATGGLFNNGAQAYNHIFYFEQFTRGTEDNRPTGKLNEAIGKEFGSFEKFQEIFSTAATTLFGSGWAWLAISPEDTLVIIQTANATNPATEGFIPLMTMDVWEHAYYLDKQNNRGAYINDLWKIINWETIQERYNKAVSI